MTSPERGATMYVNVRQAKRDAYIEAYEATRYDLTELINPSDVDSDAGSWLDIGEDRLDDEVSESVGVMSSEGQLSIVRDTLAVRILADSLPRVPLDDLVFDTEEEAVREGYWLNSLSYDRFKELVWEIGLDELDPTFDCRDEADEAVYQLGAYDKLHPFKEKDTDRV